ncbi:MAG TPA: DUF3352 domain-containing protein [Thermomicrobiales bacterium]|nr:DUF3352 domain-containing protein [Thermomicrobiales bacterium]
MVPARLLPGSSAARFAIATVLTLGTLCSTLLPASNATAQAVDTLADYVPGNSLFYAEFELDQTSDQIVLSAELIERANLDALIPDEEEETITDTVDTFGLVIDGEAAIFVDEIPVDELMSVTDMAQDATDLGTDPMAAATEEIPQGWAVVAKPSNAEQAFELYHSLVFGDEGATIITDSTYGGFDIQTNVPVDEFDTAASIALVDDVIVVASTAEDIHPVIDTVNGDLEALSATTGFSDMREYFEPEVLSFGYVNGPAIVEQVEVAGGEEALDYIESEGASLDYTHGMAFWAVEDGFQLDTISMPGEGVEVPEVTPYENMFAANLPADSIAFSGGMNLGSNPGIEAAALAIALGFITEESGGELMATPVTDPEATADQIFAEAESIIGFNIKTDVLDSLVGEWATASTIGEFDIESESLPEFSAAFVTQISDGSGVTTAAEAITAQIEAENDPTVTVSSRDLNGDAITVVTVADVDVEFTMEYGVIGDTFAIGINQPVEFATTPATPALADDSVFTQTFETLPQDDVTSVTYTNLALLIPLVQDVIEMSSNMSGTSTELDADPACGTYATQEEAQAAYDGDTFELWQLDLDFDGEACEDFFAQTTAATPEAVAVETVNVLSTGTVTFNDGVSIGSSTVILIGE